MEVLLTVIGVMSLLMAFSVLVDHFLSPDDRGPARVNGATRHDPSDYFGGTFPDHP